MWHDPMFWYAVAFAIFLALAFRYTRKPILDGLDGAIAKIRDDLERAKQLRAEAEATLAEYKQKHAAALVEAESVIRYAKEEAEQLKVQAKADLKAALARHEQQALERIRLTEAEALAAVRAAAVDQAMTIARENLAASSSRTGTLADEAIAALPQLAAKSKAA